MTAGGLDAEAFQTNPEQAQLLESRQHSAADVATMFGMDADLLNAAVSGSSLTYQNVGQRLDNFIRTTLAPNYLEPIEHGISERLTRTTVGTLQPAGSAAGRCKDSGRCFQYAVTAGMASAAGRQDCRS